MDAIAASSDRAKSTPAPRRVGLNRYQHVDQLIGKRWVCLILGALADGPRRFSEIAARIGMLSDRMLSVRLGELEAQGIVARSVLANSKPVRVEYSLTPKGADLAPIMREIEGWADRWISDEECAPAPH